MVQPSSTTASAALLENEQNDLTIRIQSLAVQEPHRVFTTYELLEAIMLHMTAFDLCMAASVCRYWKDVVETSRALKLYAAKVPPTPARDLGLWPSQLNRPGVSAWHVIVKTSHGRLIITRSGHHETMMFVPKKERERLQLLNDRNERSISLSYHFNPAPEMLQWKWLQYTTARTVTVKCPTKGDQCLLRQYLAATFPILDDYPNNLGIRFPLYDWKNHTLDKQVAD